MSKYSLAIKLRTVFSYLEGKESFNSLAEELRTSSAVVMNWVKQYKYHGADAFKKSYTSYSTQYKLDVLNYMNENGTSPNETAAIFNISEPSMIRKWRRRIENEGMDALNSKKKGRPIMNSEKQGAAKKQVPDDGSVEALKAELERLRMENAYLKKLNALVQNKEKSPKEDKAQVVYELRNEFSVKALLQLADVPRSTYYYWVKNIGRPDPDAKLKALIQAIYDEHEGRYGYRRIHDELMNRGRQLNHKKVQRIMQELGLKCLVRMKKYRSYKGMIGKIAPNILERNFHAEKPNEKWVTDISEFKLFGEKLYLSPVLDLYNGEIITYTIGSRPVYSLVSTMLDQAFSRLTDVDKPLIHSDQGWHYQMKQYRHALEERGIKQSMSRKGNCYDNAVIENFFGIMKSELLYLKEFESIAHFKQELSKYIHYYNNKRIKAKLKGMSPVQYRTHAQQIA